MNLTHLTLIVFITVGAAFKSYAQKAKKISDFIIYSDSQFFSSFPSIIRKTDGEYFLAFRRAPERKLFGEKGSNHADPNSYLMMMRSKDGINWPAKPDLLYAFPFGGSQDPCLLTLRDGTILCTSYNWVFPRADSKIKPPIFSHFTLNAVFNGGYVIRSIDGGRRWEGPYYPPNISFEHNNNAFGEPLPAFNRGALWEGKNGQIYWVVATIDKHSPLINSTHLLISYDKGITWKYSGVVAKNDSISFSETSVYETPKGDIVAFMRTEHFDGWACIARSKDGGKTFIWEKMGFRGHPITMLRLSDKRVLVTYGYRHQPYGIRAKILNSECTDFLTAPEIILRNDGGTQDIGYPWPVQMDNKRILIVYYFNKHNGTRHIAGSILQIK